MKTRTFLGGLGLAIATCLAAGSDDAGPRIVPADLDAALAWASDTAAWEGLRGARYVTAISLKAGAAEGMTALVRKELAPPGPPDGPEPQETAGSIEWIKYDVSLLVHVSAESADAALDGLLAGDRRPFAAGEEGYVVVGDGVLFPEGGEAVSQGHRTAAFRAGRYNAVIQQDWQGRRELPEGPDPVRSLLDEDLRSLAQALAERAAAASESAAPEYSVLFDKLQDLEARGDRLGALRVIPSVFECDIPVDAFQETLAATRAR
ncbi:MAG TPA: hypothetical protein PK634_09855, partial [Kiritimatiellia bacterium]|nr:hypothetical protein [Kiritimatiellia bacterium]